MKNRKILIVAVLLAVWILSACGGSAVQPVMEAPATQAPAAVYVEGVPASAPQDAYAGGAGSAEASKSSDGGVTYNVGQPEAQVQPGENPPPDTVPVVDARNEVRMIVKSAQMTLLVANPETAIDGVTQIVGDVNGYIISSRVWYQMWLDVNYKYATITFGVPVDQFETALRRLRGLAVQVTDETASGEDVSDQYVDLESQLRNLEATRERIKGFLDQTTTVDEALRINQELANIEAQIEQIKGQMNYLADRSAYSTITVTLNPQLPEVELTPTPEPTPSPSPTPWSPGPTFTEAQKTVVAAYQSIVEIVIWLVIVVIPILLPPALIVWGIAKFFNRKPKA